MTSENWAGEQLCEMLQVTTGGGTHGSRAFAEPAGNGRGAQADDAPEDAIAAKARSETATSGRRVTRRIAGVTVSPAAAL